MSTFMSGASLRSSSVTARPFMPGMLMSIRTTSGDSSRALRRASSPSAASPTTFRFLVPGEAGLQPLPDHRMIVCHQHFDYLFLRAHLLRCRLRGDFGCLILPRCDLAKP